MPGLERFIRAATFAVALALPACGQAADLSAPFSIVFGKVPDDLRPWKDAVARGAPAWAAAIGRRLPPRASIGQITILIDEEENFVARATGRTILVSAAYLRKAPDDVGVIGHELVHMFQGYPPGSEGWVVEGLADYLRYYRLEPGSARGSFDPAGGDYRGGYQAAAWLLRHVEAEHGCSVVTRLHEAMQAGRYDAGFWKRRTGYGLDALWGRAKTAASRNPAELKRASRC